MLRVAAFICTACLYMQLVDDKY